jgi:hypothetical protein
MDTLSHQVVARDHRNSKYPTGRTSHEILPRQPELLCGSIRDLDRSRKSNLKEMRQSLIVNTAVGYPDLKSSALLSG